MIRHFFFRFGSENKYFEKHYKTVSDSQIEFIGLDGEKKDCNSIVWLAMFYTNFKYKDKSKLVGTNKKCESRRGDYELHHTQKKEFDLFCEAPQKSVFWIMTRNEIVALEAIDDKIWDYDDKLLSEDPRDMKDGMDINPKFRQFKFIKKFERFDHRIPELFLTTDSSGIHGTIQELNGDRKENAQIANSLVGGTIVIKNKIELIDFLSPTQLETFIYKLFDSNGYFVSGCRGASRSLIDLHIHPDENKKGIGNMQMKKNGILIQVKRRIKSSDIKGVLGDIGPDGYLVTMQNLERLTHPNVIDRQVLEKLIEMPEAAKAMIWAERILGNECFNIEIGTSSEIKAKKAS